VKIVAAVTGGATGIFGHYLAQGGKSANFLEGIIPYSTKSTDLFLGYPPDNYCSALTARQLAMRSYERVGTLDPDSNEDERLGIGITASLMKVDKERSERKNKVFIARQTKGLTECIEIHLSKLKLWSRSMQESAISQMLYYGIDDDLRQLYRMLMNYKNIGRIEHLELNSAAFYPIIWDHSRFTDSNNYENIIIVPGSFNPVHSQHAAIVKYLREKFPNKKIKAELSITNVDKVSLDAITLEERIKHIGESKVFDDLIVSNAARFSEKFKLFTKTTFAIGADTYNRLRYSYTKIKDFYRSLELYNNKLIVFPRIDKLGQNIPIKSDNKSIIIVDDFQSNDISSSMIRKNTNLLK